MTGREAGGLQHPPILANRIIALLDLVPSYVKVVERLKVCRAGGLEEEIETSAGAQDPGTFVQRPLWLLRVMEAGEEKDDIESPVFKGRIFGAGDPFPIESGSEELLVLAALLDGFT
jgi:hypothetical protein